MTWISVFRVEPKNQRRLVDSLVKATKDASKQTSLTSARIYRSLDGRRIVNYVEGTTGHEFLTIFLKPRTIHLMMRIMKGAKVATFESYPYELSYAYEAS